MFQNIEKFSISSIFTAARISFPRVRLLAPVPGGTSCTTPALELPDNDKRDIDKRYRNNESAEKGNDHIH